VLDIQEAIVRDRHAMGVAADVVEDLFGSGEGGFGVDDPLLLSYGIEIVEEGIAITQSLQSREELELAAGEGVLEQSQEAASEEAREYSYGQEEAGVAGNPSLPVGGQSAPRDHAM